VGTEIQQDEVLKIIGLDKTRKDMVVLGALLKAQKEPTDFIDFETLREQLAKDEGSKRGKDPLIYRSLSWLETQGFLEIDKSSHKHGYNTTISIMEKAVAKIIAIKIDLLEKELQQLDSEISNLSKMEERISSITNRLVDLSVDKKDGEMPSFAQGWDNILQMLDEKVYKNLRKGDVVRITIDWLFQQDYMNSTRLKQLEQLYKKGVETRTLDRNGRDEKVRKNFREIILQWREKGYSVGYQIFPRKDATYQFVGRNTEGIVLIVSESPLSATWMPRNTNPEIVDNAISTFEKDYDAGTDLAEFEG